MKSVSTALVTAALLLRAMAASAACPLTFIQPSGALDRPVATFPEFDFRFVHSSTHLQGNPQTVKWAGGLLYHPPAASGFNDFTSAVVVDNPDPVNALTVKIEYFDHDGGSPVATNTVSIPREGHHVEAATALGATSGVGSARISSTDGRKFVGAVLFQTPCMKRNGFPNPICDTDGQPPRAGGSSMQQLQMNQGATELWWGPLPLSEISKVDFFNREAPFLFVVNPDDELDNRIRVDLTTYDRTTGIVGPTFTWRNVTLPPHGTLLEKSGPHLTSSPSNGLWDEFFAQYQLLSQPDLDVMVHVVSEDNRPILGDGVMTDIYGDEPGTSPPEQVAEIRFRMASHMLASTPVSRLVAPEFSFEPGGIVQTLIGLWNAGTSTTGSILVQYFDRDGAVVSTGTIPPLAPNQSVRIEPGVFGYPTTAVGFGWVRINGCPGNKLAGWATSEILPTGVRQFHKAFGEILDGNGGLEPGPGFQVINSSGTWQRKVTPLTRTGAVDPWTGYMKFANTSVPNVNAYWYRFFDSTGFDCTNPAGQPFAGVPYAKTSTTYEDPQTFCSPVTTVSGRVDTTRTGYKGITVIGDPFKEWGIQGFAGTP